MDNRQHHRAVLAEWIHHKDLGIHIEMFSDGLIDWVACSVVTSSLENSIREKIVHWQPTVRCRTCPDYTPYP